MKVNYMAYIRFARQNPDVIKGRIVQGDNVLIPDEYSDFFEKDEIVANKHKDDPAMIEKGKQRVAAKLAKNASIQKQIKNIQKGDDEKKEDKKEELIVPLDDVTSSVVDLKMQMQKDGKSKAEIKKAVAAYKKKLSTPKETPKETKKADTKEADPKEDKSFVKDPKTGELRKV